MRSEVAKQPLFVEGMCLKVSAIQFALYFYPTAALKVHRREDLIMSVTYNPHSLLTI